MAKCPCGTGKEFAGCCEPYILGKERPSTAETLMRSRYTAYARVELDYLFDSLHRRSRKHHDAKETREWAENSLWQGLEVLATEGGGAEDEQGTVEFVARYKIKSTGEDVEHREIAEFEKDEGRWYFVDGNTVGPPPIVRESPKVGRNDPCPCGSGKKHKKCCGVTA
jgi:SEC-C motif-containing protein